ncbi:MAG: hypothetical protein AMK69_08660 [Nitrospira bacterium SG8_3]|nr:MAG: hypothetical protein AMK69_08660 [Nitrospira bacterium SG8_3]
MSVLVDLSIFPLDKGDSLSAHVARALKIIRDSGLPYQIGPMGTSLEGEWDEVMGVVNNCFQELKKDCDRVYVALKMDYRKGPSGRIESKVKSVQEKL